MVMGQIGYLECVQMGYRQRINAVPLETGKDELLRLLRQMNPAYTVLDRKLPGRGYPTALSRLKLPEKLLGKRRVKVLGHRKEPSVFSGYPRGCTVRIWYQSGHGFARFRDNDLFPGANSI